ncbi:sugar ABC transporter ATP-binding protein [Paraburkholderia sp. SARCC-3016]|uniref:sugar ABC transporter ATP-binding protein n=1 Tax=Paraburkholderia sp. SARCC-3016 TaxID=3058611 RepID=UPI002806654F|nr:sugar ABC transporter ATP-binding protein [Paraburkholderia sp. SARCC-3016]MDQ7978853.1 sugar ABC transporter ATP-binding protein [Paraburkholderia sp. SARCC-3016]
MNDRTATQRIAGQAPVFIGLDGIGKTFGRVKALIDISFEFRAGECVGIAGHNGAGKSTLMAVLTGVFEPEQGTLSINGQPVRHYDPNAARAAGVRCVFQELSLCANLTIAENMAIVHPALSGRAWRRRATQMMRAQLDAIFPGHGLKGHELIGDLTLTQRQMVEIARAFTVTDYPVKLVILDEPTSSLDAHTAAQLLAFIAQAGARGIATVLISHMLGEIAQAAQRVLVMRDGRVAAVLPREAVTQDALIRAMGQHVEVAGEPSGARTAPETAGQQRSTYRWTLGTDGRVQIEAPRGEVVGFAGLAGQGQSEALLAVYRAATRSRERIAFVAGDRARDGVFALWSIAQNLDIRWLLGQRAMPDTSGQHEPVAANRGRAAGTAPLARFVDRRAARAIADAWRERIGIRGAPLAASILSLSGGNQQKVLFARALASDAQLILMDDPTRGVDIGTKRDIYQLVRNEAARGRTFIWYTTENDEFAYCDRTYVFRAGRVTRMLLAHECNEQSLLAASFEEIHP